MSWAIESKFLWYNISRSILGKVIYMKWSEVRSIYPNQFVKFEVLESHIEDNKEFVDEMAVIGPVADDEATKELLHAKDKILVYHTSRDNVVLKIRSRIGLRRVYKE